MSGRFLQPMRPDCQSGTLAKGVGAHLSEEDRSELRKFHEVLDRIDGALERLGLTWTQMDRMVVTGELPGNLAALDRRLADLMVSAGGAS